MTSVAGTETTEDEPEAAAPPAEAAAWRPPRGYVVAVAVLVAIGFALGALTLVFASRLGTDDEGDVRRATGEFTTALLTYDFGKLDETKQRVLSFATGGFRQQYEQAFAGGLDVILRETEARSRVTDVDVFVSDVEGDAASAIAVANTVVEGKSGSRRVVEHYVRVELVNVDGSWKVAALVNLKLGEPLDPGAGGTGTTPPANPPK